MSNFIISNQNTSNITISIEVFFWLFLASYIIHILEEALLGENFVDKIKRLYWNGYSWKRFFWYNSSLIIINITAILIYENMGGNWVIFPLILAAERFFNGIYHIFESIRFHTYSSGLLTSILFWILGYFIVKYAFLKETVPISFGIITMIFGVVIAVIPILVLYLIGKKTNITKN
jgi:hypothetical protein